MKWNEGEQSVTHGPTIALANPLWPACDNWLLKAGGDGMELLGLVCYNQLSINHNNTAAVNLHT